ncbi:MAG: hypothetical protein ACT4OK_13890 [Gemmobacter sp.]
MRPLILALLLAPAPALAETTPVSPPMTGAEFESYATGKTLTYGLGGEVYGIEQYLPGRRVLWAFKGDICREGYWYEAGQEICFVYEQDVGGPQCWTFHRIEGGIRARFTGDPNGADLSEVAQSSSPLVCSGPDVGV